MQLLVAKAQQLVIGDGFDERSGGGPVVSGSFVPVPAALRSRLPHCRAVSRTVHRGAPYRAVPPRAGPSQGPAMLCAAPAERDAITRGWRPLPAHVEAPSAGCTSRMARFSAPLPRAGARASSAAGGGCRGAERRARGGGFDR